MSPEGLATTPKRAAMGAPEKVPCSIITGFLGAGKVRRPAARPPPPPGRGERDPRARDPSRPPGVAEADVKPSPEGTSGYRGRRRAPGRFLRGLDGAKVPWDRGRRPRLFFRSPLRPAEGSGPPRRRAR